MKKFLMLFMVCAMALTVCADRVFNAYQFRPHVGITDYYTGDASQLLIYWKANNEDADFAKIPALTVPIIYDGELTFKGAAFDVNYKEFVEAAAANTPKSNFPWEDCLTEANESIKLYMSICQPCIDCFPCTVVPLGADKATAGAITFTGYEHGDVALFDATVGDETGSNATIMPITRWNLYLIDTKGTTPVARKIDLVANSDKAIFFTGPGTLYTGALVDITTDTPIAEAWEELGAGKRALIGYKGEVTSFYGKGVKRIFSLSNTYIAYLQKIDESTGAATWNNVVNASTGELQKDVVTPRFLYVSKFVGAMFMAGLDLTEKAERGAFLRANLSLDLNATYTSALLDAAYGFVPAEAGAAATSPWAVGCWYKPVQTRFCEDVIRPASLDGEDANGNPQLDDFEQLLQSDNEGLTFEHAADLADAFQTIVFNEEKDFGDDGSAESSDDTGSDDTGSDDDSGSSATEP